MGCIFCGSDELSQSVTHIVPESLGGLDSPIAPPGVTCDQCNQYFGQKVELLALKSFPFTAFRLAFGIPSKKGRLFSTESTIGVLRSTGVPNVLEIEPRNEELGRRIGTGEVNQVRLVAEVTEPLAVCRLLLKMGLEFLGKHHPDVARSARVAAARDFARRPKRGAQWWFFLRSDPAELFADHSAEGDSEMWIELREMNFVLCSVIRFPTILAIVSLEDGTEPPSESEFAPPVFRITWARC